MLSASSQMKTSIRSPSIRRWKQLTEKQLPQKAAAERWPVRVDHCFKRITLDNLFGDVWYRHLPSPAEDHLTDEQAQKAAMIAETILQGGRETLNGLNRLSLQWRGKIR